MLKCYGEGIVGEEYSNSVMVVDDSGFMRFKLKQILENSGYKVTEEAQSGSEAIKKYSVCKPDIVTMDIIMPVRDGVSTLRAIRQKDPSAKVIMISSAGTRELVIDSMRAGAKGFIVKPFVDKQVVEAMEQALK